MNDLNGYVPVYAVIASANNKVFVGDFVKLVALKDSTLQFIKSDQIQENGGDPGNATDIAFKKAAEIEGILIKSFRVSGSSQVLAYAITADVTVEDPEEL